MLHKHTVISLQQVHAVNTESYMVGKSLTDFATLQGEQLYYCITIITSVAIVTLEPVLLP